MRSRILWVLFFALAHAFHASQAAECPRHHAPGTFTNPSKPWQNTDTGVVVDGFVDFSAAPPGVFQLRHGIDLSAHNIVDYRKLRDCGADFAFVRIDKKYAQHVAALQKVDIEVYPYFYFPIPTNLRQRLYYHSQTQPSLTGNLTAFASIGKEAGRRYIASVAGAAPTTPATRATPPPPHRVDSARSMIALDIEEKLIDEEHSTPLERTYYGRNYARAVCAWAETVRERFPDNVVVLYTTPSIYFDYLDKALPEDHLCLQGFPIWLARTTVDGGDVIRSSNSVIDKYAQRVCLVSGGNRCITHQYSHRGVFGSLGATTDGTPPHIDLDRFFDMKSVDNAAGQQFVRTNSLR